MSNSVNDFLQETFSLIKNDTSSQKKILSTLKKTNKNLSENLQELTANVENIVKYSTTLDMDIARQSEKMKVLEKKLQTQREALKAAENDCEIIDLKIKSENDSVLDKFKEQEPVLIELGELFRSSPQIYEPKGLKDEMNILDEEANNLQKDFNEIEEELNTLKQVLLLPNEEENEIHNNVENMIQTLEDQKKVINSLTVIKKNLKQQSEYLNREFLRAAVFKNSLLEDLKKANV